MVVEPYWHFIEPYASLQKPSQGDWYRTKGPPTSIVCYGYSAPLGMASEEGGARLGSLKKGEYFGPVEEYMLTRNYMAVLVNGWWINVWSRRSWPSCSQGTHPHRNRNGDRNRKGVHFAFRVSPREVERWKRNGWRD